MTKKTTKRALLSSLMALLLCFTMLLGTTFAWFTDSVTSANNIIKSGNLDIVLEYWDGDSWENVEDASDILTHDLWEPGAARVAYLRAANVGTLDLKYQLGVNVVSETAGTNAAGESFLLSDYLQFGVVEGVNGENGAYTADATGRAAAIADAVDAKKISEGYTKSSALYPVGNIPADVVDGVSEIYLALVVYMPEDVGNVANYKTSEDANNPDKYRPLINLGINVVATQVEAEFDSFGDDYDANAPMPILSTPVAIPAEDVTAPVTLSTTDVVVEIPAAVINALPAEVTSIALSYTEPQVDAANNTVSFASVELVDQNGIKIDLTNNTTPIDVVLPAQTTIAAGADVVVLHDGEAVASVVVAADGSIAYTANHFCEITVVKGTAVSTAEELVAALATNGSYVLTSDIAVDASATITVPADAAVELNLNGKTIAGVNAVSDKNGDGKITSADNVVMFDVRGSLTVKNGTVTLKHEGDNFAWNACADVFYVGFNGTLNVENATIENLGGSDMAYAIDLVNATNITVNVQNSTLKSSYIALRVFNNSKTGMNNLTIKGSALQGTSRALWVHQYTAADNGGTDANLNLDLFGNGNTFTATNNAARIIEFGFTNAINFDADGNQITID